MAMQGAVAPQTANSGLLYEEVETLREKLRIANEALKKSEQELKGANKKIGEQNETIDATCEDIATLEDRLDETRSKRLLDDDIRDLARVRTLLKNGKCEEGRAELERLLDRADNCWGTLA